jgi:hypothetical protein
MDFLKWILTLENGGLYSILIAITSGLAIGIFFAHLVDKHQ